MSVTDKLPCLGSLKDGFCGNTLLPRALKAAKKEAILERSMGGGGATIPMNRCYYSYINGGGIPVAVGHSGNEHETAWSHRSAKRRLTCLEKGQTQA